MAHQFEVLGRARVPGSGQRELGETFEWAWN
jgi:hypothetical protein